MAQVNSFEKTVKNQAFVSPYLVNKFLEVCDRLKKDLDVKFEMVPANLSPNDVKDLNSLIFRYYNAIRESASAIFIYLPLECTGFEISTSLIHREEGNVKDPMALSESIVRSTENVYEKSFKYSKRKPVKLPTINQLRIIEDVAAQLNNVAEDAIALNAEVSLSQID